MTGRHSRPSPPKERNGKAIYVNGHAMVSLPLAPHFARVSAGNDSAADALYGKAMDIELVETPCLGICLINPADGLCAGCARSRDEIARWSETSDAERRAIMDVLPDRRPRQRRGGREARLRAISSEGE